jgi:thiamine kinase-like enzyme
MADFAALFLESDFPEETQDYFLDKYYSGNVPAGIKERILCYEILWDALWAQWTVIKEACGDDFGSYGLDRYTRAKENYKQLTSKH